MFLWIAPVAGALISGAASAWGQHRANQANIRQAGRQMDFQERMSSTAYQRAMADMREAGLNPMLAYMQGGAAAPGGAQAQVESVAEKGVSSAMQGAALKEQIRLIKDQQQQTRATTQSAHADAQKTHAERNILDEYLKHGRPAAEAASARSQAQLHALRIPELKAMSEMWNRIGEGGQIGRFLLPFLQQLLRR